ncbi:MAG: hypothetical protein HOV81_07770 [Kofleriaceae bacterium]|nr:hypothetical protein [Kofleriaceae bacterium]
MATNKEDPKPGSERFRDEKREGGPRMEGHQWEDYEEARDIEPEQLAGAESVPDVEAGAEQAGMGKQRGGPKAAQGTTGEGRKRMTPVSKGRDGEATQADSEDSADARPGRHGAKGTNEV